MKTVGVTANTTKSRSSDVLQSLCRLARKHGLNLLASEETANFSGGSIQGLPWNELLDKVDALIAVGGDGTMLRAVRELNGRDIPIMGINIGSLGFLTSVQENEMDRAFESLALDNYQVSLRRMAECMALRGNIRLGSYRALNDVVLQNGPSSRVIVLGLNVDGAPVTQYVCDGLIVSTPTGSTGHSLSAGGPIICPETRAMVVSLICPHTLSSRPLVLPDTSVITVSVIESVEEMLLTVDGQVGRHLSTGDKVEIRISQYHVRFLHLPGHSHFSVLRQKLHWSGSNV